MLALDIDLLGPTYEAGIRGELPEWPPHPARAFCALVAAAEPSGADDEALRWLEQQPAPRVLHPPATPSVVAAYVPTNRVRGGRHDTSQQYVGRTNGERRWPRALPEGTSVRMVWDDASPTEPVLGRLNHLARRVPYLGRAASAALLTFVQSPDPAGLQALLPAQTGTVLLRVPYDGYLGSLRRAFESGQPATTGRPLPYAEPRNSAPEAQAPVVASSPYRDMLVLGLPPGERIDARHAIAVAAAWKAAVLQRLGKPDPDDPWEAFPPAALALLHGHHDGRLHQVPFMVLPWVGPPQARGDLLGVAIGLSRDLDPGVRRAVIQLLGLDRDDGPRLRSLVVPGLRRFHLQPRDSRSTLDPMRWSRASLVWRSVLPVVLDRWPKKSYPVEEVVADGFVMAGHPRPVDIVIRPNSAVPGAPSLGRRDVRRPGGPARPAVHAVVRFRNPVMGPVVVGHLRHIGLGLFLPEMRSDA